MRFLRSLMNLGLGAIGAILGNLLAAWVLEDAWGNAITPVRLVGTVVGFALVILVLALLDARTERRAVATTGGEVSGNMQIGRSVIRVLLGTNVKCNFQFGHNVIEMLPRSWTVPPVGQEQPEGESKPPMKNPPIQQRDLRQQQMELEAQYQAFTEWIIPVDDDLRRALDSEQKLVPQERRASLAAQREEVASELERTENGLTT